MKNHEPAHTIFFDLGNVLLFFNLEKMANQLANCMKIAPAALREEHILRPEMLQNYEAGRLTSEEFYRFLQSKSSHSFSFHDMMTAMSDIFTPNTELWPIVEKLKAQGNRLVLISNTNECHFNFAYSHYPILKLFDRFILSYEVGACKPEPLIFKTALKEARGKTFYTDDIPAFVEAGRAAGLDAELFIDVPTLQQHLQKRQILPLDLFRN
jgi:glucose-1-phosphatase